MKKLFLVIGLFIWQGCGAAEDVAPRGTKRTLQKRHSAVLRPKRRKVTGFPEINNIRDGLALDVAHRGKKRALQESHSAVRRSKRGKTGFPKINNIRDGLAFALASRQKDLLFGSEDGQTPPKSDIEQALGQKAIVDIGQLIKTYAQTPLTDFESESRTISPTRGELTVSDRGRYIVEHRSSDVVVRDVKDQDVEPFVLSQDGYAGITAVAMSLDEQSVGVAYEAPDANVFRLFSVQQRSASGKDVPLKARCSQIRFARNDLIALQTRNGWLEGEVVLVNRQTLDVVRRLKGGELFSMDLSRDGRFLAIGNNCGVMLYDLNNSKTKKREGNACLNVLFSGDSSTLVDIQSDHCQAWNMHNLAEMSKTLSVDTVWDASLSYRGDVLAGTSHEGSFVWDINKNERRVVSNKTALKSCLSPDAKCVISCYPEGRMTLSDVADPSLTIDFVGEKFNEAKFLPSGRHFVTVSDQGIKMWKTAQWRPDEQKE